MPDMILSELSLKDIEGFEMIRTVRVSCNCPLLIVTDRNELFDKVVSLELGCDDYIVKPFEPKEVLARMRAFLRLYKRLPFVPNNVQPKNTEGLLVHDSLVVDRFKYQVTLDGKLVDLPPKEYSILCLLLENKDQTFSRKQILEKVWGVDYSGDIRTVDVHIKLLRESLDIHHHLSWSIKTVWGVGYKFQTISTSNDE